MYSRASECVCVSDVVARVEDGGGGGADLYNFRKLLLSGRRVVVLAFHIYDVRYDTAHTF